MARPRLLYHDLMLLDNEIGLGMVDLTGRLVAVSLSVENRGADKFAVPSPEIEPIVRKLLDGTLAPNVEDVRRLNRS